MRMARLLYISDLLGDKFLRLAVYKRDQVRLLVLPAADVRDYANKLVFDNVVAGLPREVKLEVFTFIAKEIPLFNDYGNFLRQPAIGCPKLLRILVVNCRINHQNRRQSLYCLSGHELLVLLAAIAPSPALALSLNAGLQYRRECVPL